MQSAIRSDLLSGAALDQAATGLQIWEHDGPGRIQYLRGFRHEQHAAEGDHLAVESLSLTRQLETVAHGIGQLLDLRLLIMMGQNDRVTVFFDLQNFVRNGLNCNHWVHLYS